MVSGPEESASTANGIDPLSPAQSRAARAYADTLLGPEIAGPAAEDALAAFRQAVTARGDADGGSGTPAANETLLALTRLMTAVSMPDRSSPEDRRQAVWASIGSASHCTCRESAALLATRANGNIQPRESVALDEHLATCAECRELSVASITAEAAFREQLRPPTGGFGLPGGPRAALVVAAVVIAAGAGIVALTSGGGGGGGHQSGSSAAAALAIQTQTSTTVDLQITTAAAAAPAVHHLAAKHKPHHAAVTHSSTTATHTATGTPVTTTAATSSDSADATPSPDTTPVAADTTPVAAETTPASTPTPVQAATPTTASSTAAVVSGQSSLPADSAPQQGIGNLTSTTP